MEVHLRPGTAERVRSVLGEDVNLAPADVPGVLARLAVEAPEVYSQVLSEVSGSQVHLDSERALVRRWRRGLLRRMLFWWGEYESDAGDRLIAKRQVAAAVPIGLAALLLLLFGVSHLAARRPAPGPSASAPAALVTARVAFPPIAPKPAVRSIQAPGLATPGPVVPAATPWLPVPPAPPVAPSSAGGMPHLNPVVFAPQPVTSAPPAPIRPDSPGMPSPIVYERTAPEAGEPSRAGATGLALSAERDGSGAAPLSPRWVAGQRVPARLSTGVVTVAGGPPVPVVAESTDPASVWLGRATLGSDGLVQITFSPAGAEGAAAVHGVALDPARLAPGLAGRTAIRHPQAAGMIVASALQAAADYVQALARQGQVTLTNGWAQVIDGSPAPAWTYAASRLAQDLILQGASGAPVATTELDPGTAFVILLTEAR